MGEHLENYFHYLVEKFFEKDRNNDLNLIGSLMDYFLELFKNLEEEKVKHKEIFISIVFSNLKKFNMPLEKYKEVENFFGENYIDHFNELYLFDITSVNREALDYFVERGGRFSNELISEAFDSNIDRKLLEIMVHHSDNLNRDFERKGKKVTLLNDLISRNCSLEDYDLLILSGSSVSGSLETSFENGKSLNFIEKVIEYSYDFQHDIFDNPFNMPNEIQVKIFNEMKERQIIDKVDFSLLIDEENYPHISMFFQHIKINLDIESAPNKVGNMLDNPEQTPETDMGNTSKTNKISERLRKIKRSVYSGETPKP